MKINFYTWFDARQLDFCPKHFLTTKTPVCEESLEWINETLQGRFYLYQVNDFLEFKIIPYFEDPQEAILYELTWA
jgi:hypothetical protein